MGKYPVIFVSLKGINAESFKENVKKDGTTLGQFCEALKSGEEKKVEDIFTSYLKKTISIRDTFVRKAAKETKSALEKAWRAYF